MWLAFLGAVAFAAAFLFLPRRVALALPLIVLVYWLVAAKPIWYGPYPYGVKQAGAGALFQGIRGVRAGLDRPRRAGGRGRRRPLDEPQRPLHGEPERVLQPQRRPGLLHRSPDGRRRSPSCRSRSTGGRAPCASPTGARSAPATCSTDGSVEPGRHPRRPRPGARDDGLEGQRAARPREDARSPASTRTTRGPGPRVTWSREHCRGGSLTVSLSGDAQLLPGRQHRVDALAAAASTSSPTRRPPSASRSPRAAARARSSSTSRRPPCRAR